jgi:hypothetical protein
MILDSFARIINDEKINVVASSQFFHKKDSKIIEIINISANHVDENLINRSKSLVKSAIEIQSGSEQFKHPNRYIFNNFSIEKLKNLNFTISVLVNTMEEVIHFQKENEYEVMITNLILSNDEIRKNSKSNKINEQQIIDRLNLFMEFIYYVFYLKEKLFNFSVLEEPGNNEKFTNILLTFMQAIWDAYSFIVLSKEYFELKIENEKSDNLESTKIAYKNELFKISHETKNRNQMN